MALDLVAIRAALQAAIGTIDGMRVYPTIPEKPEFPAAVVALSPDETVNYNVAMQRGLAEANFEVVLLVPLAKGFDRAQKQIDGYLSAGTGQTSSVIDALEADKTLDGAVSHCYVSAATGYGTTQPDNCPACATARLTVVVRNPRS
ncbi:MAG TPA: hypothetical protein VG899_12415 [Mycobacteriales bacterium]|nr:hypothetical protein [Mycobacteriales bacterium]